jgi:hypothetical protein
MSRIYTLLAFLLAGFSSFCLNAQIIETSSITATVITTNITCYGSNDGSIMISSASGGSGTYEYSINGGTTWQSSGSFSGLIASTYDAQIRDAASTTNVVDLGNTMIFQPMQLSATITVTPPTDFAGPGGSINISNPIGGSGAYEYSWGGIGWQSSPAFTNLGPGNYDMYMRDANHTSCIMDIDGPLNTTIPPPVSNLKATITTIDVSCNSLTNGSITISSPSGGHGTYEYSIDGPTGWQSSGLFSGLAAASTYDVWIRDAAYPADYLDLDGVGNTTMIAQPAPISAAISTTNLSCFGFNDGQITFSSVSGGSGPYLFSIDGGSTFQATTLFTGLASGTYNIFIRDSNDCSTDVDGTANTMITQPTALTATVIPTNITVNGANDGTITISSPAGGYGNYQYSIDGGTSWQSSGAFTGLANDTYDVFIRDAANENCSIDLDGTTNTTITQPDKITAIEKIGDSNVKLYPNPTSGNLTLIIGDGENNAEIVFLNALGQTVKQQSIFQRESELSLSGMPSGVYTAIVRSSGSTTVQRIVKK